MLSEEWITKQKPLVCFFKTKKIETSEVGGRFCPYWQFLCEGYFSLIQKDSVNHMHGLTAYVKGGSSLCKWHIPRKIRGFLFVSEWFYLIHTSYWHTSFASIDHHPLLCMCPAFHAVSFNINIFLINPSAYVFVFKGFNVNHKNCLKYSLGKLNFRLQSLNVILRILLFWIYIYLLTLVFLLQWLSLLWEILNVFVLVSIYFPSNSKGNVPFLDIAFD